MAASPGKAAPAAKAEAPAGGGAGSQSAERPVSGVGKSGEAKTSAQQTGGEIPGSQPQAGAQSAGDRNRAGGAGDTHRSATSEIDAGQRTRVHTELARAHIREAPNLNVNLRIGATAPRTITEYWEPVPPTIINIVPAWSSYRVIRVGNEILIIEPDTFAVVAVIEG
ncbi:hypothetical protein CR492_06580 [Methylocella silvestris]|uniref:DUF1236 domain-containing protein n=1 Tax=Methylocella silvestris TaxID=199596 RepID=A0A2J7TIR6_METSI|nr:hypothetical protein CR492_06580 [Methylocella silvestris]